jgi:hypothetical protein
MHNLIRSCPNGFRVPYGVTIEQGGLYQAVTACLVAHNTVIDSKKVGLNIGTNRMMDRKEMGIAQHPPYENRFVNNLFSSGSGTHLILNHSPENEVVDNLFVGGADVSGFVEGNLTDSISGLDDEGFPVAGSKALDKASRVEGHAFYAHLGANLDCFLNTPTS